jgi:hypothetical protein
LMVIFCHSPEDADLNLGKFNHDISYLLTKKVAL